MMATYLQLRAARTWALNEAWYAGGKSRLEAFFADLVWMQEKMISIRTPKSEATMNILQDRINWQLLSSAH